MIYSGRYSYYNPVWSSDSASVFVLKNTNAESGGGMKLNRIDFSANKLAAGDTVRKFVQALVRRDDDFARSLMKNPPAILTVSNPHPVGYRVVQSGWEGSREFVDAEIYSAYTAQPDYYIAKARFYLTLAENGYIIERVDFRENISVTADEKGSVFLTKGNRKELLFKDSDIPAQYTVKGKHRLASLAYSEAAGKQEK